MEALFTYIDQAVSGSSTLELILFVALLFSCLYLLVDIFKPKTPMTELRDISVKQPIVLRDFTLTELEEFKGLNGKPIYISARGKVFDVSRKTQFYGVNGPYGVFAGADASRCFGKMSVNPEDLNQPIDDLNPSEIETLDDWIAKFETQYDVVGTLLNAPSVPSKKND